MRLKLRGINKAYSNIINQIEDYNSYNNKLIRAKKKLIFGDNDTSKTFSTSLKTQYGLSLSCDYNSKTKENYFYVEIPAIKYDVVRGLFLSRFEFPLNAISSSKVSFNPVFISKEIEVYSFGYLIYGVVDTEIVFVFWYDRDNLADFTVSLDNDILAFNFYCKYMIMSNNRVDVLINMVNFGIANIL